jgi:putative ABC transport system permease protein
LALVRAASLVVPRRERREWLEEWQSELRVRYQRGGVEEMPARPRDSVSAPPPDAQPRTTPLPHERSFQPLRDAGGAIPDALWHAREDWRLDMLHHDVRFAVRSLLARPAFTLTILLTLALGIGANAVIFSAVDAAVLNPFEFEDPASVIGVGTVYPSLNRDLGFFERLSGPEIVDIAEEVEAIERLAAFDLGNRQIVGGDQPQNVFTGFWWHDVLPVLGVEPVLGRGFTPEDVVNREAVALISQDVWQTRFAADPAVIGRTISIDDEPYVLIGVFPPQAEVYGTALWMPMWTGLETMPRNRRQFNIIARLTDDAGVAEANVQLEAVARRTEQAYGREFEEYANWRLVADTWTDINVQNLKPAALILLGAVGFVLLLVCTNVASLLLSRSAARQREIALRAALGAGRIRIVRQLLTESALLAALGGIVGVFLAHFGLQSILGYIPSNLFADAEMHINARVLGYTAAVSALAGIVFGFAPALQSSRFELQRTLSLESGQSTGGRGRRRLNGAFVALEVALALTLLVGAGLLINSFVRINAVDPGFDTSNVLTMRLTLPWNKYEGEAIAGFFDDLTARVDALPGVAATAAASQFPPIVFSRQQFIPEGSELGDEGNLPVAYLTLADEGYFDALGISLQRGRLFSRQDRPDGTLVTVINEALADTYFPGLDPVGQRIKLGSRNDELPTLEIVGVVADTKNRGLGAETDPEMFVSLRQANGVNNQIFLIVRTRVDPSGVLEDVRAQVAAIDPEQPVYSVSTLEDRFANQFEPQRFALLMMGGFAGIALMLAAVGIYGVVSYGVADRTREIGVRIALGAGRREVIGLMVRQALVPVVVGLLMGAALSVALGTAMAGLLYGADGADPLTIVAVMVVFAGVAFVASYLPAQRASGVDPVVALRAE